MRGRFVAFVGLVIGLLTTGVLAGEDEKIKTLTDKDSGTKIKIAKGTMVVLKLPATPTAGYSWAIVKNNPEQFTLQGKSEFTPNKKGVIGGNSTQIFRFKAEGAPNSFSELELVYRRPFEKGKPPEKTFKLEVEIEKE